MSTIRFLLSLYLLVVFAWAVSSWISMLSGQAGALGRSVNRLLNPVVEPVLRPIRRILPPMRMGGMGLDASPIILFVILTVLIDVIH
jgi:YggT family protein